MFSFEPPLFPPSFFTVRFPAISFTEIFLPSAVFSATAFCSSGDSFAASYAADIPIFPFLNWSCISCTALWVMLSIFAIFELLSFIRPATTSLNFPGISSPSSFFALINASFSLFACWVFSHAVSSRLYAFPINRESSSMGWVISLYR